MPSTAGPFDIGDVVPLSVSVYDSAGALADATAVTVTITLPDGTTSTPTVSSSSTGVYSATYTPAVAGMFVESWVATGTNASAYRDSFEVVSTLGGIVSLEEVQAGLNNTNTDDDEALRSLILTASDVCEQRTKYWRRQSVTGTFDGGCPKLQLRVPVVSVTSVTETGSSVDSTGYTLDAARGWLWRGGQTTPWCWRWGRQNVSVTYVVGAPSGIIPEPIRRGVVELVRYQFNQQRGGGLPRNAGFDGVIDPASGWLIPRPVQQLWQPYAAVLVA
jgi:hypothetical protein